MRTIRLPREILQRALHGDDPCAALLYPVEVNWPELRLTEEQIVANVVARLNHEPEPFPDQSIFAIELERG